MDVPDAEEVIAALRKHPDLYREVGDLLMQEMTTATRGVQTGRFSQSRTRPPWRAHRIPPPAADMVWPTLTHAHRREPLKMEVLKARDPDLDYAKVEMRLMAFNFAQMRMLSPSRAVSLILDEPESEPSGSAR
jgi:hypothetical protein